MLTKLFGKAQARLIEFKNDERGVTAIEYGLIGIAMAVALLAIFSTGGDGTFIGELKNTFTSIATNLTNASS